VTDANLVLGYLNPDFFAAGEMTLERSLARQAIEKKIALPMGMGIEEAAEGILKVVNATMIRGIRLVSVERGYDPREFALVCFGGAGPVHAVSLAKELNIPKIIVPEAPGVNCALGLLMADFRHDYSQSFLHPMNRLDPERLTAAYRAIEEKATMQMQKEGVDEKDIVFSRSADMRYAGQGYELEVPLEHRDYGQQDIEKICETLGRIHEENYGYRMGAEAVEVVILRVTAVGILSKPKIKGEPFVGEDPTHALKDKRKVYMGGAERVIQIFDRKKLRCGNRVPSPSIIEQVDSTTVLFEGYSASVDQYRNLIIEKELA
jgi:N-methylhydantoinase A